MDMIIYLFMYSIDYRIYEEIHIVNIIELKKFEQKKKLHFYYRFFTALIYL